MLKIKSRTVIELSRDGKSKARHSTKAAALQLLCKVIALLTALVLLARAVMLVIN